MMPGQLKFSPADEFVIWLDGYLAGVTAGCEMGSRPPVHLEKIQAKLAALKAAVKAPSVATREGSITADKITSGSIVADSMRPAWLTNNVARTLELRPSDVLPGFARGGYINTAVNCGLVGEHTLAAIRSGAR